MSKKYLIGLLIVLVLLVVAVLRFWTPEDTWLCTNGAWVKHGSPSTPVPTTGCGPAAQACTMEAKICPDGSSVGRTAPNCEFAACPAMATSTITANFACSGNKTILAKFYPGSDSFVDLTLSDGRTLQVPHAMSADGARYATANESFVFWNKGNTAFIQENNITTFANCVVKAVGATTHPGWLTFTDAKTGSQFQYPPEPLAQYITPVAWPPQIQVTSGAFSCAAQTGTANLPSRTLKKTINNQTYCIEAMSEGAAGSTYTDYVYTTVQSNHLLRVIFTLRYPQCLNYDNPKQSDCLKERQTFDLDGLVDQMVQTIKL